MKASAAPVGSGAMSTESKHLYVTPVSGRSAGIVGCVVPGVLKHTRRYLDPSCSSSTRQAVGPGVGLSEMAERSRQVSFGPVRIPILSPEHLIVCKVVFDRPKDWLDVEEMIAWGTAIDAGEVLGWVREILGDDSKQYARLAALTSR